jgi:hypothetical protein
MVLEKNPNTSVGEKIKVLDLGSGIVSITVTRNKGKSHIFVTDTLVRFNFVLNITRLIFIKTSFSWVSRC